VTRLAAAALVLLALAGPVNAQQLREEIAVLQLGVRGGVPAWIAEEFTRRYVALLEEGGYRVTSEAELAERLGGFEIVQQTVDPTLTLELARLLGVRYAVSGFLQGDENSVQVTVLIVDAATRRASDLVAAQAPLARLPDLVASVHDQTSRFLTPIARPRAPGAGEFFITSTPPSAQVYLDGALAGMTPLSLPNLEPRSYAIEIRREGFIPWTDTWTAVAGQVVFVSARLAAATGGSVQVFSRPPARVLIGGVERGVSPVTIALSAGIHAVVLERLGYRPVRVDAVIRVGLVTRIDQALIPIAQRVLVVEGPEDGVPVAINGRRVGVTPYVTTSLDPGEYEVTLTADGRPPVAVMVTIPVSGVVEAFVRENRQ
jgi:hypothetical protein